MPPRDVAAPPQCSPATCAPRRDASCVFDALLWRAERLALRGAASTAPRERRERARLAHLEAFERSVLVEGLSVRLHFEVPCAEQPPLQHLQPIPDDRKLRKRPAVSSPCAPPPKRARVDREMRPAVDAGEPVGALEMARVAWERRKNELSSIRLLLPIRKRVEQQQPQQQSCKPRSPESVPRSTSSTLLRLPLIKVRHLVAGSVDTFSSEEEVASLYSAVRTDESCRHHTPSPEPHLLAPPAASSLSRESSAPRSTGIDSDEASFESREREEANNVPLVAAARCTKVRVDVRRMGREVAVMDGTEKSRSTKNELLRLVAEKSAMAKRFLSLNRFTADATLGLLASAVGCTGPDTVIHYQYTDGAFCCTKCAMKFGDIDAIVAHLATHHDVSPCDVRAWQPGYMCTPRSKFRCAAVFPSLELLDAHSRLVHRTPVAIDQVHQCTYCGLRLCSSHAFRSHLAGHRSDGHLEEINRERKEDGLALLTRTS